MATNDVRILKHGLTTQRFRVEAAALIPSPGDAIKMAATAYALLCLTGDPEQATDIFLGVSKSGGTNTASADGVVDVELCIAGTILEAKATTVTNVNTDAKLLTYLLNVVSFDRSAETAAGVITLDEDETDDLDIHGFMILDGRTTDGMLYFTPINAWLGRGLV